METHDELMLLLLINGVNKNILLTYFIFFKMFLRFDGIGNINALN